MKLSRKQRKKRKPGRKLICSDCGHMQRVHRSQFLRAARLRCELCGGPLNLRSQA